MTAVCKTMHLLLQADLFLAQYILIFLSAGAFTDGWSLSNRININRCATTTAVQPQTALLRNMHYEDPIPPIDMIYVTFYFRIITLNTSSFA